MKNNLILNKKQDEFHLILSRFSHEIRNPIALINSEIQMIEDTHPEVVSFDYWNDITANLEYTKELLNNAHKLERKRTAFTAYLKEIISSIQPTYQYLGITLKTDISPSLPALFIDPVKLKQALLNLLRNAAEAISCADGKVKLCAFSSDQRVHIVITDNGCGIPESQLNEIFKEGGTGLGLAITREIIQAHSGNIYAEIESDGETSFHIVLPEKFPG